MSKNITIEDVKLKGRQIINISKDNILSVPIPSHDNVSDSEAKIENKNENITEVITKEKVIESKPPIITPPTLKPHTSNIGRPRVSLIVVLIISLFVSAAYCIAERFMKVDVVLNSKHQVFNLKEKEFNISKNGATPIKFEIMIVGNNQSKDITLTKSQNLSKKSHGKVTFYNVYSKKIEKLSSGTYLVDDKGKSYRTDKSLNIPGFTIKNGKVLPGLATVDITAFLPGQAYNGSPKIFYVTSFKNTSKYKNIYAKVKTPLSGGASGLVYVLDTDDKTKKMLEDFRNDPSIKDNMMKKIEVPKDYILYKEATTYTSQLDNKVMSRVAKFQLNVKSTLSALLLNKEDLSRYLVRESIPGISDKELKEVTTDNIDKLKFSFTNKGQVITKDLQKISFNLSGDLSLTWHPDVTSLKSTLAGAPKNSVQSIFKEYVGISSATMKIFPPWLQYLPSDISKINIKIN